jgi:hypothetical protein
VTVQVHDARLPGGMLEVDTDDPKAAAAAAQKYIAAQKPAQAAPPPPQPNTYSDVIKSAARGLSEGAAAFGDGAAKVGALLQPSVALATMRNPAVGQAVMNGGSLNDVFSKPIPGINPQGGYHQPQTTAGKYAETIASFAPAALAPGGMVARGLRVAVPAVTSQGAGDVAHDMGARPGVETAVRIGGALAGGVAATGALRSINAVSVGKGGPAIIDPNDIAASKMRAAVASDGGTEVVGRNSAAWADSGASGPTLVDVGGNNVRRLVRASASGGTGQAQNIATDYAGRIRANFQDQVIDHTNGLTPGVRDSANSYAARLEQAQADTAKANYGAVKGQPVTMTPDALAALRGKPGQEAIAKAMEDAAANQDHQTMADLQKLQVADLDHPPTVSAQALEAVRRSMGEIGAGKAATPGNGYGAAGYFGRKAGLDTALDATPGLKPARAAYAQMQAGRDAVDTGMGVISTPSADYASQIADLAGKGGPPNLGPGLQVGARQALVNKLETGADGATGAAKTISQSSRATQNLGQTFGQDRAAQYQAAVGNEVKRVGNADYISPNTGSQTELRGQDTASLISKIPRSIYDMAIRVFDTVRGHGAPLTEAERAAIVRMGTTEADLSNLVRRNPNLNRAAIAQIAASNSSQRK